MSRLRTVSVVLCMSAALATAGCGNGPPSSSGSSGAPAGTAGVTPPPGKTPAATVEETAALQFSPTSVTAKVGDVVLFKNTGGVPHNVTFDDPGLTSINSAAMQQNDTWAVQFSVAGKYSFQCTFHPGMTGSLTIS